jgi:tetratricopeptide (TPR) repeat protein
MPAPERSIVFQRACTAVRSGRLEEAKNLLEFATATSAADAGLLNLLGVVYEARRDWRQARKLYGRAIRADGKFAPARQNMRRWYELFTFGCTEYPILLGDEPAPSALEEFLTHPRQKMTPF